MCLLSSCKTMEKAPFIMDNELLAECLMELKMPELLRLQHSLERMPELKYAEPIESRESHLALNETAVCEASKHKENGTCVSPQALALSAEKRGYDYHPWQAEEKPSKLQTIFHISITALAFLSFGGYLLCLIVQAIKSKGTTYIHPDLPTALTNGNGGVKRIKIYRRSRRAAVRERTDEGRLQYEHMTGPYNAYYSKNHQNVAQIND
ncbi:uncharacterized protein [Eurosta solidaginis]|uniref:uncharacterized protein isoform X2 n=1 Tax=Eurosta solidaginis TaxID=178769 RepID=UPI00353143A7